MPKYKNNHLVPSSVIRQWAVGKPGQMGVHVYDSKKRKSYFSTADGKRPFSFAIEPNFYVPKLNNERIVTVEKWLGSIEDTLGRFIAKINNNASEALLRDEMEFTKLLLAFFSLKNRDKYSLSKIKEFLQNNPDKKKLVQMEEGRDIDIAVLENLINLTTEEANLFGKSEIMICRNTKGNLILGDRCFFHNLIDGYSILVISPNFFIALRQTQETPVYSYNDSMGSMSHQCSRIMAENSRYWLVAATTENLKSYIPTFLQPKEDQEPVYQPVESLLHGYKII